MQKMTLLAKHPCASSKQKSATTPYDNMYSKQAMLCTQTHVPRLTSDTVKMKHTSMHRRSQHRLLHNIECTTGCTDNCCNILCLSICEALAVLSSTRCSESATIASCLPGLLEATQHQSMMSHLAAFMLLCSNPRPSTSKVRLHTLLGEHGDGYTAICLGMLLHCNSGAAETKDLYTYRQRTCYAFIHRKLFPHP